MPSSSYSSIFINIITAFDCDSGTKQLVHLRKQIAPIWFVELTSTIFPPFILQRQMPKWRNIQISGRTQKFVLLSNFQLYTIRRAIRWDFTANCVTAIDNDVRRSDRHPHLQCFNSIQCGAIQLDGKLLQVGGWWNQFVVNGIYL